MTAPVFVLHPVAEDDFEPMLALRTAAMRESLERVGRYTPERSRERLRAAFTPEHMQHLYLHPDWQGSGIGAAVLASVQDRARREGAVMRVTALKYSNANRFYLRHGFVQTGEEDVDVHYEWRPVEAVK